MYNLVNAIWTWKSRRNGRTEPTYKRNQRVTTRPKVGENAMPSMRSTFLNIIPPDPGVEADFSTEDAPTDSDQVRMHNKL